MVHMHTKVLSKLAFSHDSQRVLEKAFRGLMINTQLEQKDKQEDLIGDKLYRQNCFKKFFYQWRAEFKNSIIEDSKLREVQAKLDYKKKLVLMRKWKEQILFSHVRRAQLNTATFIHKKKLLKKSIQAFKLFHTKEKCDKLRFMQAVKFEQVKLLTTAFKILHWYKNKKQ